MEKIVTAAQMRAAEQLAEQQGTTTAQLMQNAGTSAAQLIAANMAQRRTSGPVLVLCGPGNNGGDGLVVADRLTEQGYEVTAYTFRRSDTAPERVRTVRHDGDPDLAALRHLLGDAVVLVDALLGTGRARPIEGDLAAILDLVRLMAPGRTVIALDLPSGLNADTGEADPHTVPAAMTITFGFLKRGLVLEHGPQLAGRVVCAGIGLPSAAAADVSLYRISPDDVRARIPVRLQDANKYSAGAVLVVAGSRRFTGAPQLATLGAARGGAGLVTLATGASTHPILATHLLEPTFLVLKDDEQGVLDPDEAVEAIRGTITRYKTLLIGPGLAQSDATVRLVERLLCEEGLPDGLPVVVDAEGLNALAKVERWPERKRYPLILTPHAGEMARLCGDKAAAIDEGRCDVAPRYARDWEAVVVLKGNPTVTANVDGTAVVNTTGGPNLASGGTGDVLGGLIAALAAQGAAPFDAALAGVYLHGYAGDRLAEQHGDRGTLAGDLLPMLPVAIKEVREGR